MAVCRLSFAPFGGYVRRKRGGETAAAGRRPMPVVTKRAARAVTL